MVPPAACQVKVDQHAPELPARSLNDFELHPHPPQDLVGNLQDPALEDRPGRGWDKQWHIMRFVPDVRGQQLLLSDMRHTKY